MKCGKLFVELVFVGLGEDQAFLQRLMLFCGLGKGGVKCADVPERQAKLFENSGLGLNALIGLGALSLRLAQGKGDVLRAQDVLLLLFGDQGQILSTLIKNAVEAFERGRFLSTLKPRLFALQILSGLGVGFKGGAGGLFFVR